jgi:hypothetical protein
MFNVSILEEIFIQQWKEVRHQNWYIGGVDTSGLDRLGATFQWFCRYLPEEIKNFKRFEEEINSTLYELMKDEKKYELFYWHRILPFQLGVKNLHNQFFDGDSFIRNTIGSLTAGPSTLRYYIAECIMWLENKIDSSMLKWAVLENLKRRQGSYDVELISITNSWGLFSHEQLLEIFKKDCTEQSTIDTFIKTNECNMKNRLYPIYANTVQQTLEIFGQMLETGIVMKDYQLNLFINFLPKSKKLNFDLAKSKLPNQHFLIKIE